MVAAAPAPYVFLSYASAERERALAIADALEAAGIAIWIDRASIAGGTSWGSEIVDGIRNCAALLICCSQAALQSRNVRQEIQLAWRHERAYLPLLLEPVSFPDQVQYFLEGWQWVELLDRPLADWLPAVLKALVRLGVQGAAPTPAALAAAAQPDATATAPAATSAAVAVPQPSGSGVFVGRTPELAKLSAALEDALARHGRLLFLAGEPGIGKTRTAQELAATARQRGTLVLWGRCWEGEGAPAFFPWTEALRTAVRGTDAAVLSSLPAGVAGDLCRLLPELRGLLPNAAPSPDSESEEARFRLFEAVVTLVEALTAHRPLLLVLDDLQWADKPSLLLLQYLARRLEGLPLLVLGTYGDTELDRKHPLAEVLATLRRTGAVERVLLPGLSTAEVESFVVATLEQAVSERGRVLVEALHRETEGNPFFLQETLQHLMESGGLVRREGRWTSDARDIGALGIPEGIREVIGRRLARLSEACNGLLAVAAVIGRDFAAETLERVSGAGEAAVDAALAEAEAAQIVGEVGGRAGQYRFAHALFRETLYGELPGRRVRLHRQIGEALEGQFNRHPEAHLAELAYHFLEGSPGSDVEKAIAYAERAGERAAAMYAYEEAARHYAGALAALEQAEAADEEGECRLLLALARAEGRAGVVTEAKEHYRRVAAVARRVARPDLLAAAAWGFNALSHMAWIVDAERVAFIEEALAAVGDGDSIWRARLLGSLAAAVYFAGDPGRPPTLTAEAVAIARRLNDAETLPNVLLLRCRVLRGPDHLPETLAATDELIALAAKAGDGELEFHARSCRRAAFRYLGDMAAFSAETATMERLADVTRQPNLRWAVLVTRGLLAFLAGDLAAAERLAQAALAEGERAENPTALAWFISGTLYTFCAEQERAGELEAALMAMLAPLTAPSIRTHAAFFALAVGREAMAWDEFERMAAADFAALALDPGDRLFGLCIMAEVCAWLGDRHRADILYTQLLLYRKLAAGDSARMGCFGSVAFRLGLLARTRGVLEVAVGDFEAGLALEQRMGARPFAARSRYELARTLLARAAPGDSDRARALLAEALAEAREMGMTKLVGEIAAGGPHLLLSSSPVPAGGEDDPVVDVRGPGC